MLAWATAVAVGTLAADESAAIDVTFCDLVERPSDYANRRVRLTAAVGSGLETFTLYDEGCPTDNRAGGQIWLETKDPDRGVQHVDGWSMEDFVRTTGRDLERDWETLAWTSRLEVASMPAAELTALNRALERSHDLAVTVTGRFDFDGTGRLVKGTDGAIRYTWRFGHTNGYSRRIVIEHLAVTPSKPPAPKR